MLLYISKIFSSEHVLLLSFFKAICLTKKAVWPSKSMWSKWVFQTKSAVGVVFGSSDYDRGCLVCWWCSHHPGYCLSLSSVLTLSWLTSLQDSDLRISDIPLRQINDTFCVMWPGVHRTRGHLTFPRLWKPLSEIYWAKYIQTCSIKYYTPGYFLKPWCATRYTKYNFSHCYVLLLLGSPIQGNFPAS